MHYTPADSPPGHMKGYVMTDTVNTDTLADVKAVAEQSASALTAAADRAYDAGALSTLVADAVKSLADVNYRTISKLCDTVQALAQNK